MTDCPNADVRDLLPDLVHERLDAATRAMVIAHVTACTDCTQELALLRDLLAVRRTPRVDVAAIAAAVPSYRKAVRKSWVGWRAAAAITVIVAGASSVAVLQKGVPAAVSTNVGSGSVASAVPAPEGPRVAVAPVATLPATPRTDPVPAVVAAPVEAATPRAQPSAGSERELAMGGGAINDLDDRELTSLLKDLESLDAVPSVDVESTPLSPIAPSASARPR